LTGLYITHPLSGRVGVHIVTFEACSSFTRVTACKVAHPPFVGFIARLHPGRFPRSGARKLPGTSSHRVNQHVDFKRGMVNAAAFSKYQVDGFPVA
jgi:hypothetical protein